MYHSFLIHSSADGHLGCFHVLAIVNSAVMNIGVPVSLSVLFEPRSPALQVDSLPAEPQGKPKNTGVGRLSLLQQIFPTQESNRGLLHCRRILYQLSQAWKPGSQHAGEKRGVAGLLLGRTERAARAAAH